MAAPARHLALLDYALSSLWRRRGRNGGILLVFAGVIFLVASFQMVTQALTATAERALRMAPEITIQRLLAGRQAALPASYAGRLEGIFGIRRVVPRIWGYYFDEFSGANYTVMGVETARMPGGDRLMAALDGGRMPGAGERGAAAVGRLVEELRRAKGGALLTLHRPDLTPVSFEISGVFREVTDLLTGDLVVISPADARDLFAMPPGTVTDLCVSVANPREVDTIARKIAAVLPDCRVLTRSQIRTTYQVVFGWRSGFASICLLSALAAFVILAWDKASGLTPEERREIGILKVIGWETADILAVRFWEGLIVSGVAFLIGCTAAYVHIVFFGAALFLPVLVGWSVIHPAIGLVPAVATSSFLLIFCLSVLPYLAATIVPAWRSASVPADAVLGCG